MTVTRLTIPGRPAPPAGTCHVTAATGSRIVHISGQVGTDETGAVVPGGLAAQTERALLNVALAVETAGVSVQDLTSLRLYVVDWDMSKLDELMRGGQAAAERTSIPEVASTLIGVASLFTPEMLVEIEAVAVAD